MPNSDNIQIYDNRSVLVTPGAMLRAMFRDLKQSLPVALQLSIRDFQAIYRQSWLGLFWIIAKPLAFAAGFVLLTRSRVLNLDSGDVPYTAYVLSGILIWQTFVDVMLGQLASIQRNKNAIIKQSFPRESIILSALLGSLYLHAVKMVILFVALFFAYDAYQPLYFFPFLLLSFTVILFGLFVGIILGPFSLLSADVQHALAALMLYLMLATPVAYATPESGIMHWIHTFNPLTYLIGTAREVLLGLPLTMMFECVVITLIVAGLLFFAWIVYRITFPILLEKVAS